MISNQTFGEERALYNLKNETVKNCIFDGPEEGESALKEAKNIEVYDSSFILKYPFWHVDKFKIENCNLHESCRAPLWYSNDGIIKGSILNSPKALRECNRIGLLDCEVNSVEFGWKCTDIIMKDVSLESEYVFLDSKNITFKNIEFKGHYSFQYVENVLIEDSTLDTKDAFWHGKKITVRNSTLKGEYLGWFSEGLTLINCHIEGTQPLCYCKNLKLINCTMESCDLAFEYSDVKANIKGHVDSIKNPLSGTISVDSVGEIIMEDTVKECNGKVIINNE